MWIEWGVQSVCIRCTNKREKQNGQQSCILFLWLHSILNKCTGNGYALKCIVAWCKLIREKQRLPEHSGRVKCFCCFTLMCIVSRHMNLDGSVIIQANYWVSKMTYLEFHKCPNTHTQPMHRISTICFALVFHTK